LLAVVVTILLGAARRMRLNRLAEERLEAFETVEFGRPRPPAANRSLLRRHRLAPWLIGLFAGVGLHLVVGWAPLFSIAAGAVVAILSNQAEIFWGIRKTARIEVQLADTIDLMIGALGAGAGVMVALESATRESREPLRSPLAEMVGRIRLGDDPRAVFEGLYERVPLETFLLFASTLGVQWETGGSLAPTLATVGRTVRDRVELGRRIRSNTVQSQLSTVVVLCVTYFIALVMWRSNPEQMQQFLSTTVGQGIVAGSMLLQALGMVWMSAISRMKF